MTSTSLTAFLSRNLNIEESEISQFIDACNTKMVTKEAFLLREGEHCKYGFFVESGLLRQYAIDEKGKEHTISFAPESWIVTDRESTYFNQPSAFYIQALEDSKVVLINQDFIHSLSEKIPSFSEFNNKLLHNHIRHLQNRIHQLLGASAEERYLKFIEMYPNILLRVPQTMVASYLGITPESLSRVRKEISQRHFRK